jgi:RNA polymerase sigma factor (sigma-70 family)
MDGGMDSEAELAAFCRREHPRLTAMLGAYVDNGGVGEELAQEALVRVAARWGRVRRMDNPSAFAYRVGLNLATSHLRRRQAERRARARLVDPTAMAYTDADTATVLTVRREVAALPRAQRQAVALRHVVGLTVEEAAATLGISEEAVRSRCKRGMAQLRRQLGVDEEATTDA